MNELQIGATASLMGDGWSLGHGARGTRCSAVTTVCVRRTTDHCVAAWSLCALSPVHVYVPGNALAGRQRINSSTPVWRARVKCVS